MTNEYSKIDRLAMLFELAVNYRVEINQAMEQKDLKKVLMLSNLIECTGKLIEDIESRE